MPTYGLTTEGFITKSLDTIRNEIGVALQQVFGASIRLDDQSILGQLVGIIAERLALLWELADAVNSGQDPDAATGARLEQLCLLTGTIRPSATYSAVVLTLTGDPSTVVPGGSKVATASTGDEFALDDDATLVAVDPWADTTAYAVGDRVTANGNVYECYVAGTSHTSGTGPDAEPPSFFHANGSEQDQNDIADGAGTLRWVYCGEGTAAVDGVAYAVNSGVVTGAAYDLSEIVNQVAGWDGVTNLSDADTGRAIATDAELRALREQELAAGGSSPINALRAELLRVPDVEAVSIFQNVDDTTDADGLPPHSVEAVVRGPDAPSAEFDQSIFDALLAGVAAGIKTASATGATTVTGTATDDQGTAHAMTFSRPTNVPIYIDIDVTVDEDTFPEDGDDQIKEAIVAWGEAQATGKNAVASAIIAQCFSITGVLDVTQCFIDDAPSPASSATVAISNRQLATYSTTNIAVTVTGGTP